MIYTSNERKKYLRDKHDISRYDADHLEKMMFTYNITEDQALDELKLRRHYVQERNQQLQEIFGMRNGEVC